MLISAVGSRRFRVGFCMVGSSWSVIYSVPSGATVKPATEPIYIPRAGDLHCALGVVLPQRTVFIAARVERAVRRAAATVAGNESRSGSSANSRTVTPSRMAAGLRRILLVDRAER